MTDFFLAIIVGILFLNAALLWLISSNQVTFEKNLNYKLNALTHEIRELNDHLGTVEIIMNVVADNMENGEKNDGERKNE
jgi:hypothetical protein